MQTDIYLALIVLCNVHLILFIYNYRVIYIQGLDKIIGTVQILLQYFNDLYIKDFDPNFIMGVYIHCR